MVSGGSTAALDIACLEALGEAIAAVASEVAPPVAAAGATAAVGAGAYLAASWAMQDNGPTVPPIQPERLPEEGFTVTIPVPNSSTVTSGVPLGTGVDASVPGITANTGPTLQLVDPLPQSTNDSNIVYTSNPGRAGKQQRLRDLLNDDKASSADRGWIEQEMNEIDLGKRSNIRVPPGKVLAHRRGFEARKGYDYDYSDLQDVDLHKLQHKHEGYR